MTTILPGDCPEFSLICVQCDAGQDIGSLAEAIGAGWVGLSEWDEDEAATMHLGWCRKCAPSWRKMQNNLLKMERSFKKETDVVAAGQMELFSETATS